MAPRIPNACFAPELTDEKLGEYQDRVASIPNDERELKDVLSALLNCVLTWWALPVSEKPAKEKFTFLHRGETKEIGVVPLEDAHVEALWDVTPYFRETESIEKFLDGLPLGTVEENYCCRIVDQAAFDLRTMAFHLLWHVKEIALDREPLTQDKLTA